MACVQDPAIIEARFATVHAVPRELRMLHEAEWTAAIDFETCAVPARGAVACDEPRLHSLVAASMHEA